MAGEAAIVGLLFVMLWFMFIIGIILFGLLTTAFWIWMLVDAAKRTFKKDDEKIMWILILALTGFVGALIYYFIVKRASDSKQSKQQSEQPAKATQAKQGVKTVQPKQAAKEGKAQGEQPAQSTQAKQPAKTTQPKQAAKKGKAQGGKQKN